MKELFFYFFSYFFTSVFALFATSRLSSSPPTPLLALPLLHDLFNRLDHLGVRDALLRPGLLRDRHGDGLGNHAVAGVAGVGLGELRPQAQDLGGEVDPDQHDDQRPRRPVALADAAAAQVFAN